MNEISKIKKELRRFEFICRECGCKFRLTEDNIYNDGEQIGINCSACGHTAFKKPIK